MWHAWERRERCTRFWWESPKERGHSEDQGVYRRMDQTGCLGYWLGGGVESVGSGYGPVVPSCECGGEYSGTGDTDLVHDISVPCIVSDYGLDDRAIGVRSPAEEKDFSYSLCVQTGSAVHPASCTMGTGGPFPGGKAR
jgi:hypothetical protein